MKTIGTDATPIEVLLVEDSPGDVRLTREAFKDAKVHINLNVASDGAEAMDFLDHKGKHSNAPRPDLILLDLNLPKERRPGGPGGDQGESLTEKHPPSEEATWLFVFLYRSRRAEVKSTSPRHRFLIALCSLRARPKADCSGAYQRKSLQTRSQGFGETLSPVRFHRDSCEILPISRNFQRSLGGFLCVPDCVAEQEGFELSVRFLEPSKEPHVGDS
jgi:CheY-like chemotaxis protein